MFLVYRSIIRLSVCVVVIRVQAFAITFCHGFFFFKQKTAYEMRISDWSSDVCSSDLLCLARAGAGHGRTGAQWPSARADDRRAPLSVQEIGRASCRERVCQYV